MRFPLYQGGSDHATSVAPPIVVWGSSEPANYIRNVTFRDMSFTTG